MATSQWLGAERYEEGDRLKERAEAFFRQVSWDVLIRLCSDAHQNLGCRLHDKFSLGYFNLVRHIIFEDGEEWIAKFWLPDIPTVFGQRVLLDGESIMKSEVAASKYLRYFGGGTLLYLARELGLHVMSPRLNTTVPVPNIYLYNLDPKNPVGASFMIMAYINGTTAIKLSGRKGYPPFVFGTEEQDARLKQQMAHIQVDLARCRFDSIGSLRFNGITNEFFIGPEVVTGLGPWKFSFAYYNDIAEYALKSSASNDELRSRHSFAVPLVFKDLVARFCSDDTGPFSLTNRAFGFHNVLVDENFAVIGVIRLDGIMAAPKEVVGQFPELSGLDPPAPGIPPSNPLVLKREQKEKPLIESYAALLRGLADGPERQIFADIMTTPHVLVQGLKAFEMHQDLVNDMWMQSFLYLLRTEVLSK